MIAGFARPWLLLLLLALPWWWWRMRRRTAMSAVVSELAPFVAAKSGRWKLRVPPALRALSYASLLLAAAGPFRQGDRIRLSTEGISIILVLDISSSMLTPDFAPDNRLEVAKRQAIDFVRGRRDDQIGLVIFAGEALTRVPATLDYPTLIRSIESIQAMELGEDGTAIGSGLATAVSRLRRMPGKERVVLLLTDGENNRGIIDPRTAAATAQAFGIKVYTIGVGADAESTAPTGRDANGQPTYGGTRTSIDEPLLTEIAEQTGAKYYRATDGQALGDVFHQIDQLERTPVEAVRYVRQQERTLPFVLVGLAALLLELLVAWRWVVRVP